MIVTTFINHQLSVQMEDITRAAGAVSNALLNFIAYTILFFKSVPRVATRISAYAEDSSTELTDERRLPLIGRSPKNSQKDTTLCARATRDGGEKGTRLRRRSLKKQTETKLSFCLPGHRPCTPPIHLRRAYIFGRLVFPLREIYHVPTPLLSRAAPSVPDVWQGIIGRAEEWPHRTLETTSEMARGSRVIQLQRK